MDGAVGTHTGIHSIEVGLVVNEAHRIGLRSRLCCHHQRGHSILQGRGAQRSEGGNLVIKLPLWESRESDGKEEAEWKLKPRQRTLQSFPPPQQVRPLLN